MKEEYDILSAFDILESKDESVETTEFSNEAIILEIQEHSEVVDEVQEHSQESIIATATETKENTKSSLQSTLGAFVFMLKYSATSLCIFAVLMLASNYSAYFNLAYSIIYAQELETTQKSLIESVAAANINEEEDNTEEVNTFKALEEETTQSTKYTTSIHSMGNLTKDISTDNHKLPIEITPYENRIIIPKIGKNIPLLDIKQQSVEGVKELNNIFMEELENGVVRYPGSAKPGENGNSFIFGHSSNNVWEDGDYNDVFALLDHVSYDDEVVVYYGQEKHTYKIRTKNVISPGDVSVLESDENDDRSQLTLMTCWPIGTTLNRLVLTGDLISVE